MTYGASRRSSRLLQNVSLIGEGPPHPFVDLQIGHADGELHPCYPLSQVEQFFVALSQETKVFVEHLRSKCFHPVSYQRFGQVYRLTKPRLIPHRGHVAPDAIDELRHASHQIVRSARSSRAQYPHFFLWRRRVEPGVETARSQRRRQVMWDVIREQDDYRPFGRVGDSDIAETGHMRQSATE